MPLKKLPLIAALVLMPLLAQAQDDTDKKELERLRAQVEQMKQVLMAQDAQLRQMEQKTAAAPAPAPAPAPVARPPAPPAPVAAAPAPRPAPASMPVAATAPTPVAPAPVPVYESPPARRVEGLDPAPYEAAVSGRVGMLRISQTPRWLVLDERRLVLWLTSDEAYMVGLVETCEGLLTMQTLDIEKFSTKVRARQDAVRVGGRRCVIDSLSRLNAGRIPRPPRG